MSTEEKIIDAQKMDLLIQELEGINEQLEDLIAITESKPVPENHVVDFELYKTIKRVDNKIQTVVKKLDPENAGQ